MERIPDLLVKRDPFKALMMGNHALVRAMMEAGTRVVTTYPGSPTPEIAEAIVSIPAKLRPFYFEYSTNEKVATEIAFGAAANGHLSTVFFKSVGLNVAADSAVQLPLMDIPGGMVIVLGDDPGINSSQNEQDNRHFARMAYIPVLEPATPSETYRMYLEAARLARRHHAPVFLRMTTHVCHAREQVQFGAWEPEDYPWTPQFEATRGGGYIPIAATVIPKKRRALERLALFEQAAEDSPSNTVLSPNGSEAIGGRRLGLIAASLPVMSLLENLEESGKPLDLLTLGFSYPLPSKKLHDFLSTHDEVLVIEELDPVMEQEIKAFAYDHGLTCRIHAKPGAYRIGELGSRETWEILSRTWPDVFAPRPATAEAAAVIPRLPTFCPGCGHRAAFFAVSKVLEQQPETPISVADIGCHTMGAFEPYAIGQLLLSMGHSNATAAGLAIGNRTRKVISFIGDSTFFHAGLPGIVDAVLYDHNITLVVMENGTTAMTGQQPHPGSGEVGEKISIDKVLEAFGVKHVARVSAYAHEKLVAALNEAMSIEGFTVVIASHPCMLKFGRELKKKGKGFPMVMTVEPGCDAEETARIGRFDCPSFHLKPDGTYAINHNLCIGDGSCRAASPQNKLVLKKRSEVSDESR